MAYCSILSGCSSTPPPIEQLSRADAALGDATAAETLQHAPLELRSAQQKLAQAQQLLEQKDYLGARYLAEQADR